MIFWIASYPKSGNTWLRALISSYFYSKDGFFTKEVIKNVDQFPEKIHYQGFKYDQKNVTDTTKLWIVAQERINRDKKIRFFKTHNFYGAINNCNFTNKKNTLACIYIVRDPRNIITSLKNHYELSYNEAFDFMINERKYIFDYHKKEDYSDFQFISSWKTNFQSWKYQKEFPVKFIRYEDLLEQTYFVALDLIEFINKVQNNSHKIDKIKLQNAVSSTSFDNLRKNELKHGFSESIFSKQENKKIPFFNLGPSNEWSQILDKKFQDKILNSLEDNLKELSYI